ncbi:AAA family ATPase [Sedimentibacter sp. MB31-C6]|uniref:AAA family ATPase n=1 Tax=Sedimentibacter sp. MB31-C6 TaxID=3109366 RepID=UPI002DDD6D6A|nr:AAA family ATPase [Sedimentibacter sp. MB36-C1]WSI04022.1 AAA family ATPase [Sedimentibacter sp. MB36-C1]
MRLFLGKFSGKYPEQIEKHYYSAQEKGNPWYGGVEPGDYVFVNHVGKIVALWRAKEYTNMKNIVNPKHDGVLTFEVIKEYDDVSLTNDFTRYKHFVHNLDLVNKVSKSIKNLGFIPIKTSDNCPLPEDIDFKNNLINIYISLKDIDLNPKDGDIRVLINNLDEMKIVEVQRYFNSKFYIYEDFNELYLERSPERYTIKRLNAFALKDNATQKRNFLMTLIDELEKNGFMKVSNVISLYDNLLVGRKRSAPKPPPKSGDQGVNPPELDEPDNGIDIEQYAEYAGLLNFNPNLILYGPPGTGKTYATQKIIDNFEKKHFNKSSSYKLVEAENRVRTITFHQSYSYEEFIEGIRPILNVGDNENVGYKLENGIFKDLCINAEKELIKRENNAKYIDMINSNSSIWKISLGERKSDATYNECIRIGDIAIDWLKDQNLSNSSYEDILTILEERGKGVNQAQNASSVNSFVNEMALGDVVMVYDDPRSIRMIGVIKSDYKYDSKYDFPHRKSVEWLKELSYPIDIFAENGNTNLTYKTVYRLVRMNISDVLKIISKNSTLTQSLEDKNEIKPYYIIIDEINRGNIAKIFGELITLIEQDKRGSLKTLLPYSKKEFTVPSNIYIIGTMNTADRSIAAIDTALRRRFTFVEIGPDSNVLSQAGNYIVNDKIDLTKLMDTMNDRIMERLDGDHRIGHAYFMGIETLTNLYQTWYYKILPLLGEYFYNDIESLTAIVGDSFYNNYGNVQHLSTVVNDKGISEFEQKLIDIYG